MRRAEAMDWALAASPLMVCLAGPEVFRASHEPWALASVPAAVGMSCGVRRLLIRRGADFSGYLVAAEATGMILSGRFAVTAARLGTRLAALGVGALGAWLLSFDGGRCWPGRSR